MLSEVQLKCVGAGIFKVSLLRVPVQVVLVTIVVTVDGSLFPASPAPRTIFAFGVEVGFTIVGLKRLTFKPLHCGLS